MSMPLFYKDKRDELDYILWHFDVPRDLYYRLIDLRKYFVHNVEVYNEDDNSKVMKAITIIEEIMPRIRANSETSI